MVTKEDIIYGFLKSTLVLDEPPLLAAFSSWLVDKVLPNDPDLKVDQVELVNVALSYPNEFDVYYTLSDYLGQPSFVICEKNLPLNSIALKLTMSTKLIINANELSYFLFRVDKDGDVSDAAMAKELNLPKSIIVGSKKYSYNRYEKPYEYHNYFTTLYNNQLDRDELKQFKKLSPNSPDYIDDWDSLHNDLVRHFGISDAEADDVMINGLNYPLPTKPVTEGVRKPMNKYRVFFIYKSSDTSDYMDIDAYSEAQARSYVKRLPYVYHVADVTLLYDASEEPKEEVPDKPKEEPTVPVEKCPKCGGKLNDSGECPLCDLNDESVLDEKFEAYTPEQIAFKEVENWLIEKGYHEAWAEQLYKYIRKNFKDYAWNDNLNKWVNVPTITELHKWMKKNHHDNEEWYVHLIMKYAPYLIELDNETELFEKLCEDKNTGVKEKVKDLLSKYNNEKTSRIDIFEVEPNENYVEHFDDGDIDFSKFSEHTQSDDQSKYYSFMISGGLNGSGEWDDYLEDIKKIFIELQDKLHLDPVLYQLDTDIADDVWTGKVFLYEDPTENQLKESLLYEEKEELFSMTPYMLRNDGALLECGELHPYIKMSNSASYETNLKTLNSHPHFLDWFYNNTLNEETKELINEFKKEPNEELMNLLNDLTNQEFCRVRTSNYKVKYGGDNGQIYFRISSVGFNWFDLIWNIVSKFSKDITEVTVMKDKQTFGGKEFDYYYDHLPTDEFLTLKGNPIVEGK